MIKLSHAVALASMILGGAVLQSGTASAMPMIDAAPAAVAHAEMDSGIQKAYWAGGYGWHHGYRRHYWGGPRFYGYHRPYGWHRAYGWGPRPFGWHRPFHRRFYY